MNFSLNTFLVSISGLSFAKEIAKKDIRAMKVK